MPFDNEALVELPRKRSMNTKAVYGLVLASVTLLAIACISVSNMQLEAQNVLETSHYEAPNPFEDPELRAPYDVDITKAEADSKSDFDDARGQIKEGTEIMKDVIDKLSDQDDARDDLMDQAIAISDRIHRVRHLLINLKAETNGIQTHEDTNWIYTNPFGADADPPQQDLSPFQDQIKALNTKTDKINADLKALIVKTHSARNDAITLDSELYNKIQKAKKIAAEAVDDIHQHNDEVEMFNHEDYDAIHRVDAKLNDKFRLDRHRLHGLFNLAQEMSARQPNEVSEVTALATDLLIVNAETQERLKRMQDVVDNIQFERGFRADSASK